MFTFEIPRKTEKDARQIDNQSDCCSKTCEQIEEMCITLKKIVVCNSNGFFNKHSTPFPGVTFCISALSRIQDENHENVEFCGSSGIDDQNNLPIQYVNTVDT